MNEKNIRRKFLPQQLVTGIFLIVGGISIVMLFYTIIPIMPRLLLIGAMLSVPVGVLIALSSVGRECVKCKRILETKVVNVSSKAKNDFKAAFKSKSLDNIVNAFNVKSEPTLSDLQLKCNHCPSCKNVAILSVAGWGKIEVYGKGIEELVS